MLRWLLRGLRPRFRLRALLILVALLATALGVKLRWQTFQKRSAHYASLEATTSREASRMRYASRAAASRAEACREWDAYHAARLRLEGYTGPTYSGYDHKAVAWEALAEEWARIAEGRRNESEIYAERARAYLTRW